MEESTHIGKLVLASGLSQLFTPRFFLMWSYSFTVFLSAFQLLPTAPFHILSLGGSHLEAGLFLGFLTYASAISAPITGAIADRYRQAPRPDRREPGDHGVLAALCDGAVVSGDPGAGAGPRRVLVGPAVELELLRASTSCRKSRRAEGMGYSGFASILGVAVAPWIGLWLFDHGGWRLLCFEAAGLNVS